MKKPHVRSRRVFREPAHPELAFEPSSARLPADCPAVQIRSLLEELDLGELRELYEVCGGVAYDPRRMLGALLLSYTLNVYSSREMEDRCRYDVRFMHVMDGQTPDYRTLARFRRRIEPALDEIFSQILAKCVEANLAPLRLGAVDGTKIAGNTSQLRRFLKKDPDADASDPEAAFIRGANGFVRGYNAQAMVDADTGAVLGTDVSASSNDSEQMEPVLEDAKERLGELPAQIVMDSGYDGAGNLAKAQELGTEAFIAPKDGEALFWTAVSDQETVCPMGQALAFESSFADKQGKPLDRYAVKTCGACPFQASCCGKSGRRTLRVPKGLSPSLRVLSAHRCRSPEGRAAMRRRSQSVEPFFGHIKHNKRFRRFHLRGLGGARLEILLLAACRNLELLRKLLLRLFPSWIGARNAILLLCEPENDHRRQTSPTKLRLA